MCRNPAKRRRGFPSSARLVARDSGWIALSFIGNCYSLPSRAGGAILSIGTWPAGLRIVQKRSVTTDSDAIQGVDCSGETEQRRQPICPLQAPRQDRVIRAICPMDAPLRPLEAGRPATLSGESPRARGIDRQLLQLDGPPLHFRSMTGGIFALWGDATLAHRLTSAGHTRTSRCEWRTSTCENLAASTVCAQKSRRARFGSRTYGWPLCCGDLFDACIV